MDYRHYWKFHPKADDAKYSLALMAITNILDNTLNLTANGRGDPNTEPQTQTAIVFNGLVPNSHESFYLPDSLDVIRSQDWNLTHESCNTAKKTYDKVVTACLVALKYYLDDGVTIWSDGDRDDWDDGLIIAMNHGNVDLNFEMTFN